MSGTFSNSPGGHLVISALPTDAPHLRRPMTSAMERFLIGLGDTADQDTAGATSSATGPDRNA